MICLFPELNMRELIGRAYCDYYLASQFLIFSRTLLFKKRSIT